MQHTRPGGECQREVWEGQATLADAAFFLVAASLVDPVPSPWPSVYSRAWATVL